MKSFLFLCLLCVPSALWPQEMVAIDWPNGNSKYEGEWKGELRVGKHKWWHENGEKKAEVNFSETGKPLVCYTWNEKGEIMEEVTFEYERNIAEEIKVTDWDTLKSGLLFKQLPTRSVGGERVRGSYSKVGVTYTGCLVDGSVFEETHSKPLRFKPGAGQVIKGFEEAVAQLALGEKCIVKIPPQLGYGDRLIGEIPPGSTLIYIIELTEAE